jgi:ketosteroid isomerase-like protein
MSFDPMAAAIDWLDAYRSSDLELMLNMFADDAVIQCGCCAMTTIRGKETFRAYWAQRFQDCVPYDLDDLQPSGKGTFISYVTSAGTVSAAVQFDQDGKIAFMRLGPPVLVGTHQTADHLLH